MVLAKKGQNTAAGSEYPVARILDLIVSTDAERLRWHRRNRKGKQRAWSSVARSIAYTLTVGALCLSGATPNHTQRSSATHVLMRMLLGLPRILVYSSFHLAQTKGR
jgi:hypothetical protein